MSQTNSAQFFSTDMEIQFSSTVITTQALASAFGISRMLFPVNMLEQIKLESQNAVIVKIGNYALSATLVQQYTEHGLSYSARFQDLSSEQSAYLNRRIKDEGVQAGWNRRFPRISVSHLKEEPHPQRCIFPFMGNELSWEVLNFTLGGMRLTRTGEIANLRVGRGLSITVYASGGMAISALEMEIRKFSVVPGSGGAGTTEIGLRFTEARSASRDAYQALFRECLLALQKRNT